MITFKQFLAEEGFLSKAIEKSASALCKLKGGHIPFTGISRQGKLHCKRCDAWYADDKTSARAECDRNGHVRIAGLSRISDGNKEYQCKRCKTWYDPQMNESVDPT